MNDVIDFNSRKEEILQKRRESEAETEFDITNEEFDIDFAVAVSSDVVTVLHEIGIDVRDDPNSIYDVYMIIESIRSLIQRIQGKELPFQLVSTTIFEDLIEDAEKELYFYLENVDIDLTDE